jgi:tetratricopeptide (TPR) repeat protein
MHALLHGLTATALLCLAALPAHAAAQDDDRLGAYCTNEDEQFAPDVAIEACTTLIQSGRLAPEDLATAYMSRGVSYARRQDYPRAIADYSEAIRLNPLDADAYYNRGISFRRQGDDARGIADFTEAIRLNPRDASAYNNRGTGYEAQGNHPRAIADFSAAIRLNPQRAIYYSNRASAYEEFGDHARAAADRATAARLSVR